jgi:NTP pyrophosphatase (non-canonical NTP hydrolase)
MDFNDYQKQALRTAVKQSDMLGRFPALQDAYNYACEIVGTYSDEEGDRAAFVKDVQDVMNLLSMAVNALGLVGEAAEYSELIKKAVGHGVPLDREKAVKELGDTSWYLANAAFDMETQLEDVAIKNIDKLKTRYPDGFSTEASIARVDTKK